MPGMPRPSSKAKKIAYSILGVPPNMRKDKKLYKKKIERRLLFEETSRVK